MLKRILSAITTMAMLAIVMPSSVFAIVAEDTDLIDTLTLASSDGESTDFFEPIHADASVESLEITLTFGAAITTLVDDDGELTSGYVHIKDVATDTVVKELITMDPDWTDTGLPASVDDWDGLTIDVSGEAICGDAGEVCPDGDYYVEAYIEYVSDIDANTYFENETANFSIYTTPESVNISAFDLSLDSFDPLLAAETTDVSFTTDEEGYVSVKVYDDADDDFSDPLKTLVDNQFLDAGAYTTVEMPELAWNGTDESDERLENDDYVIVITTTITDGGETSDTDQATVTLATVASVTLDTFTVVSDNGTTTFDPAPAADNEVLTINYNLSEALDSVLVEIADSDSNVVKSYSYTNSDSAEITWDGENEDGDLVYAGAYTITLTTTDSVQPPLTSDDTATVEYENSNLSTIESLTVNPSSFDPDAADTEITFTNSKDASILVEIRDDSDTAVRTFSSYQDEEDTYNADDNHSIVWNGKNDSSSQVTEGTYTVYVETRNEYGVSFDSETITVDDSEGSGSSSNSHISGIDLDPSKTFEPEKDEELEIEYDVKKDLDSLEIYAVQGSTEIELFEDDDIEEDNNFELTWDGTDDDDEYVDEGDWRIEFRSTVGSTSLTASDTIEIEYEEPKIKEFELSKDEFDPELDEFIYIMFMVDEDALIEIQILEDGDEEESIVEEMDVEGDVWYAVEWDGDDFDHDDDLDIKLIASNPVNEDIYDSEKTSVTLDEDDVSSSKSNITNDFITPILTDGEQTMVLSYELEDDADVEISIHKGTSSSGTEMIELIDVDDQESGEHTITWDGLDEDGDELKEGYYTYKITSKKSSSETEKGIFRVDNSIGDIDGDSSDDDDSSSVSSNVIIDGYTSSSSSDSSSSSNSTTGNCGGYADTGYITDEELCRAIEWVQDEGVFSGYASGLFGVNTPINRAESLKVIMEVYGVGESSTYTNSNLGFSDVTAGSWYMPYMDMAIGMGIFSGDSDSDTARPDSYVKRVEALKMVFETLESTSSYVVSDCSYTAYVDISYGSWFHPYVCESMAYSLFDTTSSYYFGPGEYATRAEMALMFYRMHESGLL